MIELGTVLMVPFAGQMLGDLGADVIRIESNKLDVSRAMDPGPHPQLSGVALNLHRNKRSIELDLKHPAGGAILNALLASADVLITNMRPSALARLDLSREQMERAYPELVIVEAHGFSPESADAERPVFDDIIQAEAGIVGLTAELTGVTTFLPFAVADKVAGLTVACAALAGLVGRPGGVAGRHFAISMFDSVLAFTLVEHLASATFSGGKPYYQRYMTANRGPHKTRDGYLAVLPYSDEQWRALYEFVGQGADLEDSIFATHQSRVINADRVYASLKEVISKRTTAEWISLCGMLDVPYGEVSSLGEIIEDPERGRGVLQWDTHPIAGKYRKIAPMVTSGEQDGPRPAPLVGEHTRELLRELGFDAEEIIQIMSSGAASQASEMKS